MGLFLIPLVSWKILTFHPSPSGLLYQVSLYNFEDIDIFFSRKIFCSDSPSTSYQVSDSRLRKCQSLWPHCLLLSASFSLLSLNHQYFFYWWHKPCWEDFWKPKQIKEKERKTKHYWFPIVHIYVYSWTNYSFFYLSPKTIHFFLYTALYLFCIWNCF